MKKYILLIFLASLILSAYSQEFVPGEIIIGFKDSVDGPEAIKIIEELNLEVKERPFAKYRHTYYFETKKYENHPIKENLEKSQLFTLVDIPLDDKGIDISSSAIFAYAKLTTTENDVKNLINSLKNIKIKSIETTPISILAKVPVGQEKNQIKKVKRHKNIQYAELNGYTGIDIDNNTSNK